MDVIGDLFTGARETMNWLTTCARLITKQEHPVAWFSPIQIPVIQPYRQSKLFQVETPYINSDRYPHSHRITYIPWIPPI